MPTKPTENPEPQEAVAEEKVAPVTFLSGCNNLTIVLEPRRRKPLGEGGDFTMIPGKRIHFVDGRYVAETQDEIDALRAHEQNGGHFHEIGYAGEGMPSDDTPALIQQIMALSFQGEEGSAKVADLLVAERNTLSRPSIIAACEQALNLGAAEIPHDPDAALAASLQA